MARYRRRRSRRRTTRRKSRRAPRRYVARKSRRSRPSVNQHHFIRSTEVVLYNDVSTGATCISSNNEILLAPSALSGGFQPYGGLGGSASNFASFFRYRLSDLVNVSEFTNLYDQYKIKGIRMTFEYAHNISTADGSSVPLPKLVYFRDFDDQGITTQMELEQREAITTRLTLNRPRTLLIKPRFKRYVQQSDTPALSSPAETYARGWLDCGNTNIQHYGLKFALIDWPCCNALGPFPARPILRIRTEYLLAFRNVR